MRETLSRFGVTAIRIGKSSVKSDRGRTRCDLADDHSRISRTLGESRKQLAPFVRPPRRSAIRPRSAHRRGSSSVDSSGKGEAEHGIERWPGCADFRLRSGQRREGRTSRPRWGHARDIRRSRSTPEATSISRKWPRRPKPVTSVAAFTPTSSIGCTAAGVELDHYFDGPLPRVQAGNRRV